MPAIPVDIQAVATEVEQHADSAQTFRQYITELQQDKKLRGNTLTVLCQFLLARSATVPWLVHFYWLLLMPRFLNIAFTGGTCNSACRMCVGRKEGQPLQYVSLAQIRQMLEHAITSDEVTLSSSDSDPLLNPDMLPILHEFDEQNISCDFYTNGLAMTSELIDSLTCTNAVNMINFSLDAISPELYREIRGRDLAKVQQHIQALCKSKTERKRKRPWISLSMVELADNIEELPELVEYAHSIGAFRVAVQPLMHKKDDPVNQSALKNPNWAQAVMKAQTIAQQHDILLTLPGKLQHALASTLETIPQTSIQEDQTTHSSITATPTETNDLNSELSTPAQEITCCTWLRGIWISIDGTIRPCCMNSSEDFGQIYEGPLNNNQIFLTKKIQLLTSKVFPSCLTYMTQCAYLSALQKQGIPVQQFVVGKPK